MYECEILTNLCDEILTAANNAGENRITRDRSVIAMAIRELNEDVSNSPRMAKLIGRWLAEHPGALDMFQHYLISAAEEAAGLHDNSIENEEEVA